MTYTDLALLSLAISVVAIARKQRKQGTRMSELSVLIEDIRVATDVDAAKLEALEAKLADLMSRGEPPTAADIETLRAVKTRLQAMGSDPANPVPTPAPEPTPEPAPDVS